MPEEILGGFVSIVLGKGWGGIYMCVCVWVCVCMGVYGRLGRRWEKGW